MTDPEIVFLVVDEGPALTWEYLQRAAARMKEIREEEHAFILVEPEVWKEIKPKRFEFVPNPEPMIFSSRRKGKKVAQWKIERRGR